jgi:hypothetical protein
MYATRHAARALACAGRSSPTRAQAIADAVLRARNADGGWDGKRAGRSLAFSTALALLTLSELGSDDAPLALAAERLVSFQLADGSFSPSAELLVPGGSSGGTMTMVDRGLFTTACAVKALHRYLGRMTRTGGDIACRASS